MTEVQEAVIIETARPEQRRPATMTMELTPSVAINEPGRYRLRFYIPTGGGAFEGYFGPDVVVR
jgi:hypothetical protein